MGRNREKKFRVRNKQLSINLGLYFRWMGLGSGSDGGRSSRNSSNGSGSCCRGNTNLPVLR